ncbi:diaminopimelate epimerase [Novosphingobium sp.]|uniref:diaminopimelate epimerase n=1 Tax=Novosphingobium sp. TaxID=1874826 RepID=UPI0025DF9433|nr:diaminopimelate epimerase [Novosphingobium sp.]
MRIPFRKMHGLGNDFVVIDRRDAALAAWPAMTGTRAAALADRQTGIGCDQVIVLEPSAVARVRMRIFNPDGGEVESCGNATRAVGMLLAGQTGAAETTIETGGGLLTARVDEAGIAVDMGAPRFDWDAIPLAYAMDTLHMPVGWEDLSDPTAVNVGNPHVVCVVADAQAVDLARLGPQIETDPLFPSRINVNVLNLAGPDHIRLRVWERGAGLTRACGTGACASAVVAIRRKLVASPVRVSLPGGDLTIAWAPGGSITMSGPATLAFEGTFDDAQFPA